MGRLPDHLLCRQSETCNALLSGTKDIERTDDKKSRALKKDDLEKKFLTVTNLVPKLVSVLSTDELFSFNTP